MSSAVIDLVDSDSEDDAAAAAAAAAAPSKKRKADSPAAGGAANKAPRGDDGAVAALMEMGAFAEAEVRAALGVAQGDADAAYEILAAAPAVQAAAAAASPAAAPAKPKLSAYELMMGGGGGGGGASGPTFVLAPGASGGDCADLGRVLAKYGTVSRQSVAKWKGNFPSQMGANVDHLRECVVAAAAAAGPAARIVVAGHSFGCRVAAEMLRRGDLPAGMACEAILDGFPMYGPSAPKKGTDRVATLLGLPAHARILMVSGEKDDFLSRTKSWRAGEPTGGEALRAVAKRLACADKATVVAIEGTGHNPLKGAKKWAVPALGTYHAALRKWLKPAEGGGQRLGS